MLDDQTMSDEQRSTHSPHRLWVHHLNAGTALRSMSGTAKSCRGTCPCHLWGAPGGAQRFPLDGLGADRLGRLDPEVTAKNGQKITCLTL